MRQRPARQGVGGEALVEHHRAGGQVVALQVGEEGGQLVRQHHALVADGVRGKRDHVEIARCRPQALFGAAARQEQRQGERHRRPGRRRHRRKPVRCAAGCLSPVVRRPNRRWAARASPAATAPARCSSSSSDGAAVRGLFGVVRQEHQAGGVALAHGDAGFLGQRAQERVGLADQQAAAVAGEAVGGDAAAMGHARQRGDGGIHQRTRRLVIELRDHAETAGIALVVGIVESLAVAGVHLFLNRIRPAGSRRSAK